MTEKITIYRPNQRHEHGFFHTWVVMAGNVARSRGLIWQLFKRDFLAAYRKSFIGLSWIFIAPLVGIVSWIFLQKTGMLQPGRTDIPYPAYVLVGTLMWGLFMGFYESAGKTLTSAQSLIFQVNYPHEILLFKQVAEFLAAFLIQLAMVLIVLIAFDVTPSPVGLLLFPLVVLPLFFLGVAIGLIDSMIAVVAVDVHKFIVIVLGLWLWLTPVIYSSQVDNELVRTLIAWNPLTYLVCSARDMIIAGRLYHAGGYWLCAGLAMALFLISWRLFYVSEGKVIERMI